LLSEITRQFYSFLFPPLEKIVNKPITAYEHLMNHIKCKVILLYGKQGSGKTECVRGIVERAIEEYGSDNVHAAIVEEGELGLLVKYGLNSKLVNILFADNITLAKLSKTSIKNFFKIRHYWKRITNRNYGYIIAILASHRIHATPLELRTNLDAIICRNAPTNPWDKNIVKHFIGEEAVEYLTALDRAREENEELYNISIVNFSNITGILIQPLAVNNYLQRIIIPKLRMTELLSKNLKTEVLLLNN